VAQNLVDGFGDGVLDLGRLALDHRHRQAVQEQDNVRALIKGLDELSVIHDNVLFEACNTSFQVHFQVAAEEFARLYNVAQVVTSPVLAAAVNSPVLLQHRLWQETRVALFQQSVDERSETFQHRGRRPRVSFGDDWIKKSVLEIFREDVARFRLVLTTDLGEASTQVLDRGETPQLQALRLHNGTVYRWNRACYGVMNGKAHLRIENRALPAGPTIRDEIANAAFFFGLMSAVADEYDDVTEVMSFDDAKGNFTMAARQGLKAQFQWFDGRSYSAEQLILTRALPSARRGLESHGVDQKDIDLYLGVIEARVTSGQTGSQWILDSLASMKRGTRDERYRTIAAAMWEHQREGAPVHEWPLARVGGVTADWRSSYRTVGQVMTSDVFTVGPEDLVDLAASLMDWEHVRHVPVEDSDGKLVGLVSHRAMLRIVGRGLGREPAEPVAVREIMTPNPLSVGPETGVLQAIQLMRANQVSCLPVTKEGRLVGIVTERDFLDVAARLFEDQLSSMDGAD
ncbi:MAG: CBS domain-containing protein, partial [Planctomycetota bacterium]